MTLKEFMKVAECDSVGVCSRGFLQELDADDDLMMEAYGDFVVEKAKFFHCPEEDKIACEITVKMRVMREVA